MRRLYAHADDIELTRLVKAQLHATGAEVATVSRNVFCKRPTELSMFLSGSKTLTPKAFLRLVEELGVDKDIELLKLWVAGFLLHRDSGFLSVVHEAGLITEASCSRIKAEDAPEPVVSLTWKRFSSIETAGKLRLRICRSLAERGPSQATTLAASIREMVLPVRGALVAMRELGYVVTSSVQMRVRSVGGKKRNARRVEWTLTEAGETAATDGAWQPPVVQARAGAT